MDVRQTTVESARSMFGDRLVDVVVRCSPHGRDGQQCHEYVLVRCHHGVSEARFSQVSNGWGPCRKCGYEKQTEKRRLDGISWAQGKWPDHQIVGGKPWIEANGSRTFMVDGICPTCEQPFHVRVSGLRRGQSPCNTCSHRGCMQSRAKRDPDGESSNYLIRKGDFVKVGCGKPRTGGVVFREPGTNLSCWEREQSLLKALPMRVSREKALELGDSPYGWTDEWRFDPDRHAEALWSACGGRL